MGWYDRAIIEYGSLGFGDEEIPKKKTRDIARFYNPRLKPREVK